MGGGSLPRGRALVSCPVAAAPPALGPQVPPGGNKTQYDEIGIPVALLSHKDMLDIFKVGPPAPSSPHLVWGHEYLMGRDPGARPSAMGWQVGGSYHTRPQLPGRGLAVPLSSGNGEPALEVRAPRPQGLCHAATERWLPGQWADPAHTRPCLTRGPCSPTVWGVGSGAGELPDTSRTGTFSLWKRLHVSILTVASTALPSLLDDSQATCPLLRARIRVQV